MKTYENIRKDGCNFCRFIRNKNNKNMMTTSSFIDFFIVKLKQTKTENTNM